MNTIFPVTGIGFLVFMFFTIIFLYINSQILYQDYSIRKIPNRLLLFLFGGGCIYATFFSNFSVSITILILGIFFLGFILHYFDIWAAGDLKYFLVLIFFIKPEEIIIFIANIGLVTIGTIFIEASLFYLKNTRYNGDLHISLKTHLSHNVFRKYIDNKNRFLLREFLLTTMRVGFFFFLIFIFERLLRSKIIQESSSLNSIVGQSPLIIVSISLFITLFILGSKKLGYILFEKYTINLSLKQKNYLLGTITISLVLACVYLSFLYINSPDGHSFASLFLFIGYTLVIFLAVRLFYSLYSIYFKFSSETFIEIQDIREGLMLDTGFLSKMFLQPDFLRHPSIYSREYLQIFRGPLDTEKKELLKKLYTDFNEYYTHTLGEKHKPFTLVKIYYDFPFSLFIFSGFVLTFFFGDSMFRFLVQLLFS